MATIGSWGTAITFKVSDSEAVVLSSMSRTVGAEYAEHSRIGDKSRSEFIRSKLQTISFSMILDAGLGAKPRDTMDAIAKECEKGTAEYFVLGGKRVGSNRWRIDSINETWETMLTKGELYRATVSVTMTEYL